MKEFQWTGKKEGIVVRGSLESESLDDAIAILKGREIEVEELVENDQRSTSATQSKSEHDNDKSTSTSTKLIDVLDQCEFLNGLSEKKKHRFQEKLKARLKKSIGLNPDQDLSAVEVDEVNVDKIKSTIQSTVSFSWLGLFLTFFWAAYHKIQLAYAIMLFLFVPSYILLFLDYDWYEVFENFVGRGSIGIGVVYGMYGRGWLIGDQFARIARERYQVNSRTVPKWLHLGTNFEHGWIRVLAIVGLAVLLVGIQMGLEYLLYPELW